MLKKLRIFLQLLALQISARGQSLPFEQVPHNNPLQTELDSILHEQVRVFFTKAKAPGLLVGISQQGEKSFYSYGFADTASKKMMGPNTIFEIGSITKTFVTNLVFQLHEKKIMDVDKSLADLIPGTDKNDPVLSTIILRQIASHTSGLPRLPSRMENVNGYTLMQPYRMYEREELYEAVKQLKGIKPGRYQYSNLGYGLLGTIAENETKQDLQSLLVKYIWSPLGMNSSYIHSEKTHSDSATGYFYGKPAEYWKFGCLAGAGAIKSNAADMLKYLDAHITGNFSAFSTVVTKIIEPVHPVTANMQVAYGWHTFEDLKHRVTWHNGGTYGFSTFGGFEPVSKTSIVLVSNSMGVNAPLDRLAKDLFILLMGN